MSYLQLSIDSLSFTITKAHIKESLQSPFVISCEGYIESIHSDILHVFSMQTKTSTSLTHTPNVYDSSFHPNLLLDSQATFSFTNLYAQHNILSFTHNTSRTANPKSTNTYHGIITQVSYLGTSSKEHTSSQNTSKLQYKHCFSLSLSATLIRLCYNNASRIYTNSTVVDIIKSLLYANASFLGKALDFSFIHAQYPIQEIITQYNESDLAFLVRIAHNSGLYFYEDATTLYVCDSMPSHISPSSTNQTTTTNHTHTSLQTGTAKQANPSLPSSASSSITTLLYNPNATNTLNEECISNFGTSQSIKAHTFSAAYSPHTTPSDIVLDTHTPYSLHDNSHTHDSIHTTSATSYLQEHTYTTNLSFTQNPNTKAFLTLQQQHALMTHALFEATSNITHLHLGQLVALQHAHASTPKDLLDTTFYVIAIEHTLISKEQDTSVLSTNNTNTHNKSLDSNHYYSNTLTLLPTHLTFIPSPKAKPTPPISTQGIVVGEGYTQATNLTQANATLQQEANTIYTDSYGRIQVRPHVFYAYALHQAHNTTQQGNDDITQYNTTQQGNDENTQHHNYGVAQQNGYNIPQQHNKSIQQSNDDITQSPMYNAQSLHTTTQTTATSTPTSATTSLLHTHTAFLRVAYPIASNSSGFFALPRVGDEVIIAYMDNDIDKPFISGSLYNTTNPIPSTLPKQDHITTLSSKTIGAQEYGYNQLCFSNLKDNEEISLRAQKDYTQSINNNFSQTIQNNKDSKVKGSYTESITKYHKQEILGLKDVRVGAEYLTNVALSKDTIVGLSNTLNVGVDNTLRVAKDSSEVVGGDKTIEIGNNLSSNIGGDLHQVVKGEKQEHIEGSLTQSVVKDIDVFAANNHTITTNSSIFLNANENMTLESKKHLTLHSDTSDITATTDMAIQVGKNLNFNIGETTITATSDSIIIKAGGVEVTIDSNGLIVKGGEVKSE
ncbi:type VI secretion system Vgr family protein [Helicobacter trogontum]|uniref:type VI secretion system Vgr family protein n=2 Tax=Helicobacter trogontum TaxID=50960 RepID=UPI000CF04829|nr:contractile injection system protein, VgrG/Pvc8 family [Helicobacter trogontum]